MTAALVLAPKRLVGTALDNQANVPLHAATVYFVVLKRAMTPILSIQMDVHTAAQSRLATLVPALLVFASLFAVTLQSEVSSRVTIKTLSLEMDVILTVSV